MLILYAIQLLSDHRQKHLALYHILHIQSQKTLSQFKAIIFYIAQKLEQKERDLVRPEYN